MTPSRKERVAIFGSRKFVQTQEDRVRVCDTVRQLPAGTVVVSGGAPGVDTLATDEANAIGLIAVTVNAPWDVHGRAAGPMRNKIIADIADRGFAFWDGQSPGTQHTIREFEKRGKRVDIHRQYGRVKR